MSEVGVGGTGRLTVTTTIWTHQKGVTVYLETSACEASDETMSLKNTHHLVHIEGTMCDEFVLSKLHCPFVEILFASSFQI